jgi:Prokaryotic membrane lipoprotein lipid attachment site
MAEVVTKLSRRIAFGLGAILVLAACSLGWQ